MHQKINIIQQDTDLLLILHFQNDLIMLTGNFPVPDGEQIIEPIKKIYHFFKKIALCQLWLPLHHKAFKTVKYCIQGSWGAEHPYLGNEFYMKTPFQTIHGLNINMPINNYFSHPDFLTTIGNLKCQRIFLCGLTLETDVKELALILKDQGFEIIIFEDCVKPRDKAAGEIAKQDLKMAGISFMPSAHFFE